MRIIYLQGGKTLCSELLKCFKKTVLILYNVIKNMPGTEYLKCSVHTCHVVICLSSLFEHVISYKEMIRHDRSIHLPEMSIVKNIQYSLHT